MVTTVKVIFINQSIMLCFLLTNTMLFDLEPFKVKQQHSFHASWAYVLNLPSFSTRCSICTDRPVNYPACP